MVKVLVLDVDETLLTMEPLFYLKRFHKDYIKKQQALLSIFGKDYSIMPRPFVKEFLAELNSNFDLVAWSIADREVTKEKLKILGLDHYFVNVLGKQELINGKKSLTWLANHFKLSKNEIIAVDDRPELYDVKENVLQITPWLAGSNENDAELLKMIGLVESKFSKVSSSEPEEIKNIVV